MGLSQAPARPATKRKPLNPARVYQAWAADVSQHGRRGSFRRTAELVGCTPEYIRQLVAKHEAAHAPKPELFTAHELDYLPAPGEMPLPRPAQPPTFASKEATPPSTSTCVPYVEQDAVLNSNSCETGETTQPASDKQPQVAEPKNEVLPLGEKTTDAPQTRPAAVSGAPAASVKRYAPRPAPRPAHAGIVEWAKENLFAPGPALAVLAFLLLVLLMAR